MDLTRQTKTLFQSLLVMITLLINSVGPAFGSWVSYLEIQAVEADDAILICTGSQMKWASLSAFEATGTLVEIAPPSSAKDIPPCPLFLFDDYQQEGIIIPHFDNESIARFNTEASLQYYLATLKSRFEPFIVRGPPFQV